MKLDGKVYVLFVGLLMFSGCTTLEPISDFKPPTEVASSPSENEVMTVDLGSSLIQKTKLSKFSILELVNKLSAGEGIVNFHMIAMPGKYMARKENEKYLYYYPESGLKHLFTGGLISGLKISKVDTKDISLFFEFKNEQFYILKTNQKAVYQINEIAQPGEGSFKQEFIYNGKQGNYVRFLYRELVNNIVRIPFTQDVQYDLSESKIIGFKGARIEIIEATNTDLKYKIIKSFTDNP